MTDHAYHALESHIAGFTLWASQLKVDATISRPCGDLPQGSARRVPYLVEHVQQHLEERSPEEEGTFAFGLDLILDGLEGTLRAA